MTNDTNPNHTTIATLVAAPVAVPAKAKQRRKRFASKSPWTILFDYHLQRARINQSDFADRLGVVHSTVNHYCTGRLLPPMGDTLDQMCRIFLMDPAEERIFREEALLATSPPEIRQLINRLRDEIQLARRGRA